MTPRLIAVVGATATGKTALAIALARSLDGEIVNADSRQIYRGMDIGTAKPTAAERDAAPHHLIDIIEPDDPFSLALYLDLARKTLDELWARGKQPILVGGTGQYLWSLVEGWRVPRVPPDAALRSELEARAEREGAEVLAAELRAIDAASADAIDGRNVRRIIRAIEVTRATGVPFSEWRKKDAPPFDTAIVGLRLDRAALHARIDERVDAMIRAGLIGEVQALARAGYNCDLPSMSSIGYREICAYLGGESTLAAATARIKTETHRLARVQHTWFRDDDPRIAWLDAAVRDLPARALAAL